MRLRSVGIAGVALGLLALPALTRRAPAEAAFSNGMAKASAVVSKLAPGVGSLELGMNTGISVAEVRNSLAQAQSQSADLGLIGSSLTAGGCDGGQATIKPEQLPQPLRVDNRAGDASASADEVPLGTSSFGGGRKEVSATKRPSASASTTDVALGLAPVVALSGGRSSASATVVPGEARVASATADLDLDLGGAVHLSGLHWWAQHRTGSSPQAAGGFEVASAAIGQVPLPTDQLGPLQDALNTALAPTGVSVQLPRVEHITSPVDLIRVSPLRVLLKDSPVGHTVLGPVLDATRDQRSQAYESLVALSCQLAGALLIGDIGTNILSGSGFLVIDFGGAEAATAELNLSNPFGDEGPPPDAAPEPSASA